MEDGVLGNLAPPGDLEESASHHFNDIDFLWFSMSDAENENVSRVPVPGQQRC